MERVAIGNTGLEVNRLGFGGIPIQRVDENRRSGSDAYLMVPHSGNM